LANFLAECDETEFGIWNFKNMIQLSKNYSLPEREEDVIPMKVAGVGGAGCNALDRIVLDGLEKADHIAINTEVQSLSSSVAATKVQLGRTTTRGLGAGGDPEVGYDAAAESADEIRQALAGARMVFVCAGLGGGTGSGAAPVVAQIAREAGSLVVGLATLPFSFEGRRRMIQAQEALERFNKNADAVICFENDRMGDMVAPRAGIHQAFAVADNTISQSVRSIVNLIQRPGLIRIGFDDLLAALRTKNGRCLFGFGESESDNRAHDALTLALKNPLMNRGKMLADASHVLVQVAGGPGMTLSEVEILMKDLGKHISDHTQIFFGTAVDTRMGNRLSVTLISSLGVGAGEVDPGKAQRAFAQIESRAQPPRLHPVEPAPIEASAPPPPPIWEQPDEAPIVETSAEEIETAPVLETEFAEFAQVENSEPVAEIEEQSAVEEPSPPPVPVAPKKKLILPKEKPASEKKYAKQEVLQFEPVTRGRFEKSEPTIVEGQDLDVPTFLRKNVRVK
jgi:cell division protein FtsZ